jgi:glycosyltransferase involved in cell wall biosynthesis
MRKNILILGHSYGMQFIESCNQYTHLFDKQTHEVTVAYLVGEPDDQIVSKTAAENVLFLNFSRRDIRGLKISAIRQLLALCREKNFEIVICHRYKPTYIMLWVAQFCRIPALFFVMHAIGTMQSVARRLLIAALVRKNMTFAGVSSAVRDDLRKDMWCIPPQRIVTLYNIIDHELFEPQFISRDEARQELQIAADAFVFGHIGRFVKEKDQKTLLQAFAQMKPYCPTAKLVIIGDGRLEAELKHEAHDLQIANDVIFSGYITDGYRLMKAFDVTVLCSIKEAFGRVLLEAMVARVPIIATKICGIPEVVGDTGFLVDAANPKQLATMMTDVYQKSKTELHQCGEKGYQRKLEHFSIEPFKKHFNTLTFKREQP